MPEKEKIQNESSVSGVLIPQNPVLGQTQTVVREEKIVYTQELPEVFEFCDAEKIQPLVNKLFKRVIRCISGSHLQVADRAMCLFESESFISIIKQYKTISFNMLVPCVNYLAEHHWHQMLKESLSALKEILQKIDPQAYNNALETANQKKSDKNQ